MRGLCLLITLLLAGCDPGICIFCSPPNPTSYPLPNVGQWVAYGGNEPTINGNSFAFPTDSNHIAGYVYTQLPAVPKPGQTLTMNFSVDGNNPIWQQDPSNGTGNDINPPTMHLFLWRKGDNLSCAGAYNFYRLFSDRTPLVLGDNQIMSVPLNSANWIGCYGAVDAASFANTLANLAGAGVTFGGQYFAGHGIYISGGSATFKINSLTVQ